MSHENEERKPLLQDDNERNEEHNNLETEETSDLPPQITSKKPNYKPLLCIAISFSLILIIFLTVIVTVIVPKKVQEAANNDGLIYNRIRILNISNSGVGLSFLASRVDETPNPIAVTMMASNFSIVALRNISSMYHKECCPTIPKPQEPASLYHPWKLLSLLNLHLKDWKQDQIPYQQSVTVANIPIPDIIIRPDSTRPEIDFSTLINEFDLNYVTSILEEAFKRKPMSPILIRIESFSEFKLEYLGSYMIPMWSYISLNFNGPPQKPNILKKDIVFNPDDPSKPLFKFDVTLELALDSPMFLPALDFATSFKFDYNATTILKATLANLKISNGLLHMRAFGVSTDTTAALNLVTRVSDAGSAQVRIHGGKIEWFKQTPISWLEGFIENIDGEITLLASDFEVDGLKEIVNFVQ